MAQDKKTTPEQEEAENAPKPARGSDEERRERITALVLRRTKLSASEAVLLREVFPEILDVHHDPLWNQIRRRSQDDQEANDRMQEMLLTLYKKILEEGFPDSIPGMASSLIEGKLRNHVRARKRAPDSVCLPSSGSEKPPSAPDVDRALDLWELSQQLLRQLSPEHQEVVEEVILNGLSHGDAAAALGIPVGTVKSRLIAAKRALLALAERLLPPSQRVSP